MRYEKGMEGQRSIDLTQVLEWSDGEVRSVGDSLVVEEPLEIRLAGKPVSVTMRTPGHDLELAVGFLFTEGIVESESAVEGLGMRRRSPELDGGRAASFHGQQQRNLIDFDAADCDLNVADLQRNFFVASSCGICGKASIDAIRRRGLRSPDAAFRFDPEVLCTLPDVLKSQQKIFGRTGALHAAGLFSATGELLVLREDVGRHNAVDKVVGWALMEGRLPLSKEILMVSGRGGFEIVQKALAAGVPAIASVSAPSSLAVQLAREFGATLVGFVRGRRFVVYSGSSRCMNLQPVSYQ